MEINRRSYIENFARLIGAVLLSREPTPTPNPSPVIPTPTPTPTSEPATTTPTPPAPPAEVTVKNSLLIPHYLNPKEQYLCTAAGLQLVGLVSFYSREGCVGCSKDLRMANGVPLDDNRPTIACNTMPLYSKLVSDPNIVVSTPVRLTNLDNGLVAYAWITDTGGFTSRIADLTPRIMNSILAVTDKSKIQIDQLKPIEKLL